ncbi:MAG: hypothetical protein R6X13_09635 [bacterium]
MKRAIIALSLALALAAPAFAQSWILEQVDVGASDAHFVRRGDTLYMAYSQSSGAVRLATSSGMGWQFEDLDTALLHPHGQLSFDVSLNGRPAVSSASTGYRRVVERSDTGWTVAWSRTDTTIFAEGMYVCWTPTGQLLVARDCFEGTSRSSVIVESRTGSQWTVDTAVVVTVNPAYWCNIVLYDFGSGSSGRPVMLYKASWGWQPNADPPWDHYINWAQRHDSLWITGTYGGGIAVYVDGYAITDGADGARCGLYKMGANTCCEGELLLPYAITGGAVQVDSGGRTCLALALPGGDAQFWFKDTGWHRETIPGVFGVTDCDLQLSRAGQPLVAILCSGGDLWLARGVDIVGVEKGRLKPDAQRITLRPTVVRGVLRLAEDLGHDPNSPGAIGSCPASLLDAAGRRVMSLRAGANDVNGLAPGVYFVVTPHPVPLPQGERERPAAVTKVVLTR